MYCTYEKMERFHTMLSFALFSVLVNVMYSSHCSNLSYLLLALVPPCLYKYPTNHTSLSLSREDNLNKLGMAKKLMANKGLNQGGRQEWTFKWQETGVL